MKVILMFDKIMNFIEYFKYLNNPISTLLFKFGFKKESEIKVKNTNKVIKLNSTQILDRLMNLLPVVAEDKFENFINYIGDLSEDKEIIYIDNIKYYNVFNNNFKKKHSKMYNLCNEEFFTDDQWTMIDFKNRNVIDIGANVADTALYFAKEGAKVIGFEPVKHLYELGHENILLNPNLKANIRLINKAVGGKRGTLNISNQSTIEYIDGDDYDIDVITVTDILNNYDFPADVLKMDCEGCEFEIILNEDLSRFNDIIFEHHSIFVDENHEILVSTLKKQGFKINLYPNNSIKRKFEDIGIIHAFK